MATHRYAAFLDEVQGWESGLFREVFSGADDLQVAIIRALHQHDLAAAGAPVDLQDIAERALAALPEEERGRYHGTGALVLAVAAGPRQSILRPQEIEDPSLAEDMHKESWDVAGMRTLTPFVFPNRAAVLRLEAGPLSEDLLVLLRRQWKG